MTDILHIYTRVSSAVQEAQGTSLQSQEELGIAKANELGFEYKLWNEGGRSSRFEDLHNRPVLRKLMLEIEEGKVAHLFVFNTDRLSRNQKTWGGIRWKLKQNDVRLYTPSGVISLSSPMDDLVLGILSEISQYDNALRRERSQIGKLKKVQSGYCTEDRHPLGTVSKMECWLKTKTKVNGSSVSMIVTDY
ncbi:recombinase family protein [Terasakiella sp. SH-1]|uniref:recombinase family protein n=1 Tax=Terasakiella sp. SH-1 TaxID=2560057 RepID=UPI0010739F46|nr:recombinase family protein [Terasakiella sp. SH-1]